MDLIDWPSPNHGPRRGRDAPDMVVLHYTAMETPRAALDRLCDPVPEVSAHYLIAETGEVYALVPEARRAWHAGAGAWGTCGDVNSASVGIELANTGAHPFPEPQMAALETLLGGICARWDIPTERVIGHSDMAPARKSDPGPRFDWARLARAGLAVWPDVGASAGEGDMQAFLAAAGAFGYPVEGEAPEAVLTAFRMRFRPWAEGPLDPVDVAMARDLADRFPVDRRSTRA